MKEENLSATEAAVNKYLLQAQEQISDLEDRIDNLPSDKGPEYKPKGGPGAMQTRGYERVDLEKEIAALKEQTLEKIDHELKDASAEI